MIDEYRNLTRGQYRVGDTLSWGIGTVIVMEKQALGEDEERVGVVVVPEFKQTGKEPELTLIHAGRYLQRLCAYYRYHDMDGEYGAALTALKQIEALA